MAHLKNQKIISGLIGNLVFQNRNGKQIIKSRPAHVRQTKATKSSASEFGNCSGWSKQLRQGLLPFLVNLSDSTMYQRFTAQVYKALLTNTDIPKGQRTPLNADMSALNGFEFNAHSPLQLYFQPIITATLNAQRQVTVTVPTLQTATEMIYPENCTQAELLVYVYATNFADNAPIVDSYVVVALPFQTNSIPETVWISPELPEEYFVLVTAKLLYYNLNPFTERTYLNSKEMNPSVVVLASATGN